MASAGQVRIAILTSSDCNLGGMERNAVNLTRIFRQQGYDTRCVFPKTPNTGRLLEWCRQQGVEAAGTEALLNYNSIHTLATTRRLRNLLAAWHLTAASFHYPAKLPLKDMLAARLAGARRCVATIHCMPESLSYRQRMMTRLASLLVDAVIVHSNAVGRTLIAAGVPAGKVTCVPLGIHNSEKTPTKEAARSRLGLPADAFVVGTLARLVPEKGIAGLIEVVERWQGEVNAPYLLIAGDGPQRDELAALATSRLGGRARLLGHISGENLADFYAALDVFALAPLVQEAFGMVYIEAALFGVPSVGWRVGGVAEAVLDGETGLLVEAHDLVGLEQAITRLRTDTVLRTQLGAKAQARASSEFTETRMAEAYARVLCLPRSTPIRQDNSLITEPQMQ